MAEEKKRKELMEEWGLSVDQINEVFEAAERVSKEVSDEDIDKVLKDLLRDPNWAIRTFVETLEVLNEYFKEFGQDRGRDHFFKWSLERAEKKEVGE